MTGDDILAVARAALPFFVLLLVAGLLIVVFPAIVTWLPQPMAAR